MIVRQGSCQEVLNNLVYNTKSKTLGQGQEVQDELAFKILTVLFPWSGRQKNRGNQSPAGKATKTHMHLWIRTQENQIFRLASVGSNKETIPAFKAQQFLEAAERLWLVWISLPRRH